MSTSKESAAAQRKAVKPQRPVRPVGQKASTAAPHHMASVGTADDLYVAISDADAVIGFLRMTAV